ncbi:MAG: glycine--tRNA ligase [Leptolyngbya sp. PLA3]|nr:MAG: glycine--tRNA ligase [Cyanobacteria bacterium CYA]MCE7968553.1 glycine--tRNA ligase [Leptolyngbya sp. PL-A3]
MEAIVSLCKRRGFIYPASEIYGGINGFWDYGPLGAQLKKNLRDAWWQDMILNPCWGRSGPDGNRVTCVPVETRIIQHPKVWEASGHAGGFNDPMQTCRQCKKLVRADHVSDMLRETEWFPPLVSLFRTGDYLQWDLLSTWIKKHGQKHAKGMALVRDQKKMHDVLFAFDDELRRRGEEMTLEQFIQRVATPHDSAQLSDMCPNCGGDLTPPRAFNLMFKTFVGATTEQTDDNAAFLRPETAQGIFVQFKNVVDTTRVRVPFGIGNTGTSFRNEVTPRNFTFRSREFEQAELEFFCHPDESQDWYRFWRDFRMEWWQSIGLRGDNLILREHEKDELSHYSTGTSDVEYRFPFTAPGFGELEGIAHRGCFDLTQHQQHSGAKLDYFDTDRGETLPNGSKKGERYIPHVIEPAAGLDRGALALLCEAYTRDESRPSPEIMRFHPRMAPIKAAVFPLVNKDGMPEVAEKLHAELFRRFGHAGFVETDAKQSIGKRYARMDEAGCPYCFTIDGQTLTDQTVTVRDRDSGSQQRINVSKAVDYLMGRML